MKIPFERSLEGRRVLLTGHTGFKGGWMAHWLHEIGAIVHGVALEPDTNPSMFDATGVADVVDHNILDIGNQEALAKLVSDIQPEVVFHLAAQPLVRRSYDDPIETFRTNALGTAHLLEACRLAGSPKAILSVTTDKVYRNLEQKTPYVETSELGGRDPYSASKVSAEFISASYRESYFSNENPVALATARGGNVIGGGDWAEDRLIPDIVKAITTDQPLTIRNPGAVRPWQHVLALCHGYLQLADALLTEGEKYASAWNFGPETDDMISVDQIIRLFEKSWTLPPLQRPQQLEETKHETQLLMLDCHKAKTQLDWKPAWHLEKAMTNTADWYRQYESCPTDARMVTRAQISDYRAAIDAQSRNQN